MNRFKNIMLYAGLEPEDFRACKPDIDEDNRKRLSTFLMISVLFLFVILCISKEMDDLMKNSAIYHVGLIASAGLLLVERFFKDRRGLFQFWLMYAFEAELYAIGIALAVNSPDQPSVSFVAFLMAVPLMFTMPPLQHISNILFHATAFVLLAYLFESGHTRNLDVVNAVSFTLISAVISTYMMISVCRDFSSGRKLQHIANYDLLTGVQNRNAYESSYSLWEEYCNQSLCCVYVDVNDLHGRNNRMGHESGDQMLRTVAQEMQELFGRKGCYRIGGDEFVAFVPDRSRQEVQQDVEQLHQRLLQKGYSVSVGIAWQDVRELEMKSLTKLAEKRMYAEKRDYYRNPLA